MGLVGNGWICWLVFVEFYCVGVLVNLLCVCFVDILIFGVGFEVFGVWWVVVRWVGYGDW